MHECDKYLLSVKGHHNNTHIPIILSFVVVDVLFDVVVIVEVDPSSSSVNNSQHY